MVFVDTTCKFIKMILSLITNLKDALHHEVPIPKFLQCHRIMNRVDIYDTKIKNSSPVFDRGYPKGLQELFDLGPSLGSGGFGEVRVAVEKNTGIEYACKSIKKLLDVTNVSPQKQEQHLLNIDREIKVLKLLKGTLSVVSFKGAWEDDRDIHIVMEYCRGGELYHSIGRQPYTEERVSVYMRSVLQTLAQCHSLRILHRDIKPGNFLLLTKEDDSPLKAVDFGLAVIYEKGDLPRRDLGLDGTPWFMAPEVIADSETFPASDVWSAGVMCYQLLSGHLPFDDAKNRNSPSLSIVWKSILTEDLSFNGTIWSRVSDEAKGFVKKLLNKDPKVRPSASEALKDPWLQSTFHKGKPRTLDSTVVQRLQRFAQTNLLQRTILELVAAELLKLYPLSLPDPTVRHKRMLDAESNSSASPMSSSGCLSPPDDKQALLFPMSPIKGNQNMEDIEEDSISPSNRLKYGKNVQALSGSAHGRKDYWRAMRQASDYILHSSGHGRSDYLHACSVNPRERIEQKKAARLSLDTSVHGTSKPIIPKNSKDEHVEENKIQLKDVFPNNDAIFLQNEGNEMDTDNVSTLEEGGRGRNLALEALQSLREDDPQTNQSDTSAKISIKGSPLTNPETLVPLMKKVGFRKGKGMSKESLMTGLDHIGYKVESQEVSTLMERLGIGEKEGIDAPEFIASQLDWKDLQRNNKELWIECAKQAFEGLDSSDTGHITTQKLINSLRQKLPEDELDYAVEDALVEAGVKDPEQVDFESFLKMVTLGSQNSMDSLDKYDDRMRR